MKRTGWLVALLLVVGAGSIGAWWFARDEGDGVTYRTARLERGPLQAVVSASGTVSPVSQVQIGSQVSGQIKDLLVDFNSEVKRGQLIARLDPESFEYRLRQASADVEAARASVLTAQANVQSALAQASRAQVELAEAKRDLERKQGLVAQNFISPAEADTARAKVATLAESLKATQALARVAQAQVNTAEAVVRQREAQQAQARVDLERTQIRSPVDGIVIKRSVELGQTVAASLQAPELFIIAKNLDDMQIEAAIDEADIARVRVGQKVGFTIDAFAGRSFEGSVRQVRKAATANQAVVTYTVVVGFANPNSTMLPGMTANVRIVVETRDDVLKAPNAALRVRIPGLDAPTGTASPRTSAAQAPGLGLVPAAHAQSRSAEGGARRERAQADGPLGEFRSRLVAELQLTPAQTQTVDAILAARRPAFAQLRGLPDEERGKARERILADLRAQIGEVLTPEQKPKYQALLAEIGGRQGTRGRLYLLGEDGKPHAVAVRLGITDGVSTEIIESGPRAPGAELLKEGATVITAVIGTSQGQGQRGLPMQSRPMVF